MRNVYTIVLLLILSLFGACKEKVEFNSELYRSKEVFIAFKAATGNNYKYVVTSGSWTGFGSSTTLTIKNGKVVGRSYVATRLADTGRTVVVLKEWVEDAAGLGSHEEGAVMQTLDDVYERARTEWLKKREDAYVYFEAKNKGMISTAGYVEKNCADDCFRGISIGAIDKL